MPDIFLLRQMLPLLHAPICIFDEKGRVLQALEDVKEAKLPAPEDFERVEWKYPAWNQAEESAEKRNSQVDENNVVTAREKKALPYPYIHVEKNGVAYCIMRSDKEGELIGLGKLRMYDFGDEEAFQYPYCGKEEFGAIISILWKMVSGNEVGAGTLWAKNIDSGIFLEEQVVKEIFVYKEEGRRHNPYEQELRELDSIRRGDVIALQKSIDEAYSGKAGTLANDPVRQYKNLAICVIAGASRSAIKGGLNPELAFSMSDAFIRNIEDNLTEPVKIEKATRDAEFEFAKAVHCLRGKKTDNPLVEQVKDYIFCHSHEPIRVSEIADAVGVTPNYLSEQFSQSMGITLKQYIIDEKIATSEQLLKFTDYSLQEISSYCAFSSQSRFSEYFQRKNGITPAKYRKYYQRKGME